MPGDFYRVLQVDRSAHPEVIRAAYRALLRAVGKHPDVGGNAEQAREVIDAYRMLIDTDRRHRYDLWLRAHAAAPDVGRATLPAEAADWIAAALPDHAPARSAPFAAHFDLVLGPRGPLANLLYVKAFSVAHPATWPRLFTLWRAVRLARSGGWPRRDVILAVTERGAGLGTFLEESARPRTRSSWTRCDLVACTFPPPALHLAAGAQVPAVLQRLRAAC